MSADTCADIALGLPISLGQTIWLPPSGPLYSSYFGTSNYASQNCHPASPGPHVQIYEMLPQDSGTLSITTGLDMNGNPDCQPPGYNQDTCFQHVMWIVGDDCQQGAELKCTAMETISVPVLGGHAYYLFFSGNGPGIGQYVSGRYELRVRLQ